MNAEDKERVLYQGATFQNFDKPFSFVPASAGAAWKENFVLDNSLLEGVSTCQEVADGEIFENGQTQKFITLTKDQSSVERLWKNIRNAVLKHNFVLGTRMPMPKTKEK